MRDLTVILMRYSSEEQRGGVSLELQERDCREFESRTPHRDGLLREICVLKDEATSGTYVLCRPAVKQVLDLAHAGKVARILVWRIDRLGRDEAETFTVVKELEGLGVELLSATQPNEPFIRGINILMAAKESRDTSIRTRGAMRQIAHEGFFPGGRPPTGLKIVHIPDPKGRTDKKGVPKTRIRLQRADDISEVVVQIFQSAGEGWSDKRLAHGLNLQGKLAPGKRGRGWDSATVRNIRMNPVYCGDLVTNRFRFVRKPGGKRVGIENPREEWQIIRDCPNIEPLVSRELWQRAQRSDLTPRKRGGGRGRNPKYALSGLVLCEDCGSSMVVSRTTRKGHVYLNLRCGYSVRRGNAICTNNHGVDHKQVFDAVLDVLHEELFANRNIASLVEMVGEQLKRLTRENQASQGSLDSEIKKEEAKLMRVFEAIEVGHGAVPSLVARAKELEERIAGLRARVAPVPNPPTRPVQNLEARVRSRVSRAQDLLSRGSVPEVQTEMKKHLNALTINKHGRLRLEGSLGGLLQGETAVRNSSSGGGI